MANVIQDVRRKPDTDPITANIAGIRIDGLHFSAIVHEVIARSLNGVKPSYVVTPNVQHIVMLQDDPAFRKIYREALFAVPDGVPLLWAAKMLGNTLRGRVNGTDLFEALCASAARNGLKVFLLGGRPGAAVGAEQTLTRRHPSLQICGTYCPPFGFEKDPVEDAKAVAAVQAAAPDLLFVGLGAPKQEYWIAGHLADMRVPVSLGIGNSFEFVAGLVSRAPRWMQRLGLEWLHRLYSEPARLWKRYVFGNATFVRLIARQFTVQSILAALSLRDMLEPSDLLTAVLKNADSTRS